MAIFDHVRCELDGGDRNGFDERFCGAWTLFSIGVDYKLTFRGHYLHVSRYDVCFLAC